MRVHAALLVALLLVPLAAGAVVETGTGVEYPDSITVDVAGQSFAMVATGAGVREKTIFKVNVYTIVSYVRAADAAALAAAPDPGLALRDLDAPKRLRMDLVRSFSRDKLINAFREVILKNYDDIAPFAAQMDTFFAYFDRDARDGDELVFDYIPAVGLITTLNGEIKGTIPGFTFARALWTVWFGTKPASDGLKRALLSELETYAMSR